ncbi:MAG: hypothetical protein IKL07_01200, partial [Clostridium sp.]|nr:hypothetical protein [Clostridium sp.]
MSYITCEEIEIDGFLPLNRVFSISTKNEGNEHGSAVIIAEMDKEEEGKIETLEKNQTISVHAKDRSKLKRNLFVGYLDEVNVLESEGIYDKLKIKLITKSCVLDQKRKSRSFQDVSTSYGSIMKITGQETGDVKVVCYQGDNEKIGMPIIQYLETNWQFIKRLASHFRASVFVDETVTGTTLQIGIKHQDGGEELIGRDTIWGISENYFQQDQDAQELSKKDFLYRKVVSDCNVKIASQVHFHGQNFYVQKKEIVTENGVIKFVYILGSSKLLECRTVYNEHLAGVSIIGDVLDVHNETMKLKLKLDDDQQNEATAYYYNWTPISGNLMYCMPEKGTSVSLYFPDADEKTATLVDCIRLNGGTNPKFSNPSDKYLTTDANKMLKMTEEVLEVSTVGESGEEHGFTMKSKESIYITSSSYISIKGLNVQLEGKSISVKMPVEISILQCKEGDANVGSTIINAEFNFSGEEVSIDGILVTKYPLIKDEPEGGEVDKQGIFRNVVVGLLVTAAVCAVAAAVTFFTFGTGAIFAGAVIGAAVAGIATTVSTAIGDFKSGKVTDAKKLAGKVLLDATIGAVT